MGVWSDYCLICGGPYRNEAIDDDDNEIIHEECDWLTKSYTITEKNKKYPTDMIDCGESKYQNKKFSVCPLNWDDKDKEEIIAIGCHRDCYKLLKEEFNYQLKFSDVHDKLHEYLCVLSDTTIYGKMDEYAFGQEFENNAFVENKWLLENPFKNKKNKNRILKIWKPLINDLFNKKFETKN